MSEMVEAARQALGPVGVFLPHSFTEHVTADAQRDAARRFERAGYGAVWVNEFPGKDALVQSAVLLAATGRVVVATGIANVWVRPPVSAQAAAAQLAEAYPGRFVLGLGAGHPHQAEAVGAAYGSPVETMRAYLEAMTGGGFVRIVGANRPRMTALAAELADGVMPAMVSAEQTARTRAAIGPGALLAVLVDASTGSDEEVAALVAGQLAAGADHVVAGLPLNHDVTSGVDRLAALGPVLTAS